MVCPFAKHNRFLASSFLLTTYMYYNILREDLWKPQWFELSVLLLDFGHRKVS